MKKVQAMIKSKTSSILSILGSSIFASLFYDILASTSYETTLSDGEYTTIAIAKYSTFEIFSRIFGVLLIVCFIIYFVLPSLLHIVDMLRVRRRSKHNSAEILSTYNSTKSCIREIYERQISETPQSFLLYSQDLFLCINKLYKIFSVPKEQNKHPMSGIIRYGTSIDGITSHIAYYEFATLLDCAQEITKKFKEISSSQTLASDCDTANFRIEKIRETITQAPHN